MNVIGGSKSGGGVGGGVGGGGGGGGAGALNHSWKITSGYRFP